MRTLISIFTLPEEIDDLERTLIQLKHASKYLTDDEVILDISLGTSDILTDWKSSKLPKSFFISKFEQLKSYTDWCSEISFNTSEDILGCVSQRRISSKKYNVDNIIWLDTDVIFSPLTLKYVLNSAQNLMDNEITTYIISPEIVKIWDDTWNSLVNKNFLSKECGYEKINDPYNDSGVHGDISLEQTDASNIGYNQPKLKFAGGWFTCLSKSVLDLYPVPESFGHYGLEDTFIMWADSKFNKVTQFKIKNLVICEDYKYRDKRHYLDVISKINRKDEFLFTARKNFELELNKIWAKNE